VSVPWEVGSAVLRAALLGSDRRLAGIAAELVGDFSDTPAGVDLLKECLRAEDEGIRQRGVEVLESFASAGLASLLARSLQDEAEIVRRSASSTLGIIVGMPSHPLRQEVLEALAQAGGPLARAVLANEDVHVRRQVAQALAFARSDLALPALAELSDDQDGEVRQEAVLALAAIGTPQAVEMMVAHLADPSYRVVASALDMLSASLGGGSSEFLGCLRRALDHPSAEVRRHAVLMLNAFDLPQTRDILEKAAVDEDFEVARGASEMLRGLGAEARMDWLSRDMAEQVGGERARAVWEAGDIGREATQNTGTAGDAVPFLEDILAHGSSSEKVHALSELSSLVDIGDSGAMQDALNDPASAVRNRAADTFSYTRDAGFLAWVMKNHPDAMVRRRAAEVLVANPGGPAAARRARTAISFASERTVGVALFGHFLAALRDRDPVVQEHACEAVRECARGAELLPVRRTLEELHRLAGDDAVSVLLQDDAENAADVVEKAGFGRTVAEAGDGVLAWWQELVAQAGALRWDEDRGAFAVGGGLGPEVAEAWARDYRLSEAQAQGIRPALLGGGPLDPELTGIISQGLVGDLCAACDALAHAARALRLIAQEGHEERLAQWAEVLATAPSLEWGEALRGTGHLRRLRRRLARARIEVQRCLKSFGLETGTDPLGEALDDEDDWCSLTALTAALEMGDGTARPKDLRALCERNLDDEDFCEPVGRAALALLAGGQADGPRLAAGALEGADVDLRMDLTHALLAAAQDEPVMELLRGWLAGREVSTMAAACMALAVRGAGGDLGDANVPEAGGEPELRCALLALRAMANDAEAAQSLEAMLRNGESSERYLAGSCLGLARVWTAVLIFYSVRDQDVPYSLSLLCAASMVRLGHPAGVPWFRKVVQSPAGRDLAEMLVHVGRAVEDTIPLMLQCSAVNVGRFV